MARAKPESRFVEFDLFSTCSFTINISSEVYRTSSGFALAMSLVIDDYELSNKVVIDDNEIAISAMTFIVTLDAH